LHTSVGDLILGLNSLKYSYSAVLLMATNIPNWKLSGDWYGLFRTTQVQTLNSIPVPSRNYCPL
ncbi:MAG: hypothetical protein WCE96_06095, partial [Nitrososphaeraceae archaeon]